MTRTYLSTVASGPGRKAGRGEFIISSRHGTVRVYTRRHIHGCPLISTDENRCSCPKWIYSKARGGDPIQESAHTPSFAEACEQAQKILESFAPPTVQAPPDKVALGRRAEERKLIPVRQVEEITKARITLAACLQLDGLKPYEMTDQLYPPTAALARDEKTADRTKRFDATKKLIARRATGIALENQRLAALPAEERKSIRARLSTQIHTLP